jgi:hypothetical protein
MIIAGRAIASRIVAFIVVAIAVVGTVAFVLATQSRIAGRSSNISRST